MSLELLDPESEQLYAELKGRIIENSEKVSLTFDALVRIRDGRLYRAEFKTFDAFCLSVGMNTRKAYRLLEDKAKKPKRIAAPKPGPTALEKLAEVPIYSGPVTPPEELAGHVANDVSFIITPETPAEKVQAMMQRLSLKPAIDVRAEQYRTHTPIPAMDRPEKHTLKAPVSLELSKDRPQLVLHEGRWTAIPGTELSRAAASSELKAWAVKRRATNDATSEDDAAWACYIAQQIML